MQKINVSLIELVKNTWDSLYASQTDIIKTVDNFFHQNYQQCINGVQMSRAEYIQHILEQKKNMTITSIEYTHVLEKENELFAIYYPRGKNNNNSPIEAEVIAYFHFEDKKILGIHGLVRLVKGDLVDVDMKRK